MLCSSKKKEEALMKKEQRFVKIYSQGTLEGLEIWVDRETGVNYFYHFSGYSGGLAPLLGADGKPVVSPLPIEE